MQLHGHISQRQILKIGQPGLPAQAKIIFLGGKQQTFPLCLRPKLPQTPEISRFIGLMIAQPQLLLHRKAAFGYLLRKCLRIPNPCKKYGILRLR